MDFRHKENHMSLKNIAGNTRSAFERVRDGKPLTRSDRDKIVAFYLEAIDQDRQRALEVAELQYNASRSDVRDE